jgi:hypothetical protein
MIIYKSKQINKQTKMLKTKQKKTKNNKKEQKKQKYTQPPFVFY